MQNKIKFIGIIIMIIGFIAVFYKVFLTIPIQSIELILIIIGGLISQVEEK